jgi:hypothetical protein
VQPVTSPAAAMESNQWDKRILMISPFGKALFAAPVLSLPAAGVVARCVGSRGVKADARSA